jgi:hypothetical protein
VPAELPEDRENAARIFGSPHMHDGVDDDVGGGDMDTSHGTFDAIDRSSACQLLAVADGMQSSMSMLFFLSISRVISPTPAALL